MRLKALLALLPLLSGCVIFSSPDQDRQGALDTHRAMWDAAGISDYSMRFQRLCFNCSVEFLVPVRITVKDDTLDQVADIETGEPVEETIEGAFLTIEQLFDLIQDAINQNAVQIDIAYDEDLGYPRDVSVDLSRSRFNDTAQFEIREFEELN
jgi:hypothetical protein